MADWNPNFPAVAGLEWMPTVGGVTRVREPHPSRLQRFESTVAGTIGRVRFGGQFTAAASGHLWTIGEVIPAGAEQPGPVTTVDLFPNSDESIGTWRTLTGSSSSLWSMLGGPVDWPNSTVQASGIRNTQGYSNYVASVDASEFGPGGIYEGARICRLQVVLAAAAVNGGFRPLQVGVTHQGALQRTTGDLRIHGYGQVHTVTYGELNPVTGLPWLPADIAAFDVGGDWAVRVRARASSSRNTSTVFALALRLQVIPVENRAAVGVWQRPAGGVPGIGAGGLAVVETGLVSVPDGQPGWAKPAGGEFLVGWRQARSPSLHSGTNVAGDVRWVTAAQRLGSGGNPAGVTGPPGGLVSDTVPHDVYGLPTRAFRGGSDGAAAAFALVNDQDQVDPDSQPYQLSLLELTELSAGRSVGQQITPSAPVSLMTVRTVVIPPLSGNPTLRVTVRDMATGEVTGGTFAINTQTIRQLPVGPGGLRYVEGNLPGGALLLPGRPYEIRLSVSGGSWLAFAPHAAAGPEASFGGTTDGLVVNGLLDPDRDLVVNMLAQPDPPRDVTATVVDVPNSSWTCQTGSVEHVQVTWDLPATPLGASFDRYELERQLLADVVGTDCEPRQPSTLTTTSAAAGGAASTPPVATVGAQELQATVTARPERWDSPQTLIGQWAGTSDRAWRFGTDSDGHLVFGFANPDGTGEHTRTSTAPVPAADMPVSVRCRFTPNDGTGSTGGVGMAAEAEHSTGPSATQVAPSVTADDAGDLLMCAWIGRDSTGNSTYTVPGGMAEGAETAGSISVMADATETLNAAGPTGTRTATFSNSTMWGAASVTVRSDGALNIEETLATTATSGAINQTTVTTSSSTQAGWWLIAFHATASTVFSVPSGPQGAGWSPLASSGVAGLGTTPIRVWAKPVTTSGPQEVTFEALAADQHVRLFVVSDVSTDASDVTRFEVSLDGVLWDQLGATITTPSGGVAVPASSGPVTVGDGMAGDLMSAEVRVAGVTVTAPDFTVEPAGAGMFEDPIGRLWTVHPPAGLVEDPEAAPIEPDDPDCVWTRVATVRDETVRRVMDHEVPRGHTARYRLRQVANTAAFSEWAHSGPATPNAKGAEIVFTSNQAPDLELVYERSPEEDIGFLTHESTEVVPIHGAPYQVVFIEPDDRGRDAQFTVTVNFRDRPLDRRGDPIGGDAVFGPLDEFTRNPSLPYIAVLDAWGNRWLGHVHLSTATHEQPGHRYHAPVRVTPTVADSLPIVTNPPT